MVLITRKEQEAIRKRFSNVYFASTRHKVYCEPRRDIIAFLVAYRRKY